MNENILNMLGSLAWIIIIPFIIWKPEKIITPINKIYRKFSRIATPFPPKDSFFEFRPQTAVLARIIAVILLGLSVAGFYLNLMELIQKR